MAAIQQPRQLAERSAIARPVQPVEDTIGPRGSEQLREVGADEFARQFWAFFDRRVANQQVVDGVQLSHDADGVLQAPAVSPKKRSETLREGAK